MRVAIDESPIANKKHVKHRVRGVGYYVKNLKAELKNEFPKEEFFFFTDERSIPKNVNVIHYPYFEPFFLTLPYKKFAKRVVTVHDLTPLVFPEFFPSGLKGRIKWEIQKRILEQSDRIISDSEASKKDLIRFTNIREDVIDVIYLAVSQTFHKIKDTQYLTSVKKRYNLPDQFVLYVGDVTWNKNLPRLLHSIQQIHVPLVLAGKALIESVSDPMNPWNQDLVTVQSIIKEDPLFIRLGFVPDEDLPALYNLASVFSMPSLYEGFGLPILEAMACGCPVVTSKEGSIPEVVSDAAEFVDAYSSKDIARGMISILHNQKKRTQLSSNGIARAREFSWKKTAKQTFETYHKASQS